MHVTKKNVSWRWESSFSYFRQLRRTLLFKAESSEAEFSSFQAATMHPSLSSKEPGQFHVGTRSSFQVAGEYHFREAWIMLTRDLQPCHLESVAFSSRTRCQLCAKFSSPRNPSRGEVRIPWPHPPEPLLAENSAPRFSTEPGSPCKWLQTP